jgi:hypothetical protein
VDLKELIAATKGNRSYEDLARAAGNTPQAARWWAMATEDLKVAPTPPTIKSVARALGVTEQTVWMSVGESLGLAVSDRASKLLQLIPPGTDRLSDDAVASVLSLLRVLLTQAPTPEPEPAPEPAAEPAAEPTPITRRKRAKTS